VNDLEKQPGSGESYVRICDGVRNVQDTIICHETLGRHNWLRLVQPSRL